ncbi:50S ribosomal protein L7/L12 [Streptococcus catagoni]|uniref:50S ribosomal protein L7/L12 n=1 Tax=Streptococcus catagoni TaxID=2654874 RepID=UPI00140BFFD7|nr:50S ribosomal protein L7/L12 [Streptococcus catagoni]
MDYTWLFILGLYGILVTSLLTNSNKDKKIKKMQKQLDELCRLTGHEEIVSLNLSENEEALLLSLKNEGKNIEAIKKIRELTGADLTKAKEYIDNL